MLSFELSKEVVEAKSSGSANNEIFIKITTFLFRRFGAFKAMGNL